MWKISSGNLYRILFEMDFARRFFYAAPHALKKQLHFLRYVVWRPQRRGARRRRTGPREPGGPGGLQKFCWRNLWIFSGGLLWAAAGRGGPSLGDFGESGACVCRWWGIPAKTLEMRWVNTRPPGNKSLPGRLQEPMEERAVCCCRRPGGRFYQLFGSQGGVFNINVMRQA